MQNKPYQAQNGLAIAFKTSSLGLSTMAKTQAGPAAQDEDDGQPVGDGRRRRGVQQQRPRAQGDPAFAGQARPATAVAFFMRVAAARAFSGLMPAPRVPEGFRPSR